MKYSIEQLGLLLKKTRKEKGLSQQALSVKIAIPQSHISKIESGLVDLQTSSLIEMARVLELELMLVPRYLMPAVQALQRHTKETQVPRPMYYLEEDEDEQ